MTFKKELVEKIAREWAVIEGKGDLFDLCKTDAAAEAEYGHYEGYIADAYCLLGDNPEMTELTPEILNKTSW